MKQLLSITMLLFFLLGQVNLAWASHYCGDELMSSEVSLAPEKSDCCGDDAPKAMDCCEDEVTVADADDFFGKSEISFNVSAEFVLAYAITFFSSENFTTKGQLKPTTEPDHPKPDFQVLYQNFLI